MQPSLGSGILDRVGNTPLIRIDGLDDRSHDVEVLGKAEWANPGGSVKDRAAKAIVLDGIERGLIGPGKKKHLLDATSGNTGIAYAMLGAAMGFPVTLVMPSNVSPERKQILAAYGVKILWTDRGGRDRWCDLQGARHGLEPSREVLVRRPIFKRQ